MQDRKWIPLREGARRLDVCYPTIRRLINAGQLSVRQLPGCHPRVAADELHALAQHHTRPARLVAAAELAADDTRLARLIADNTRVAGQRPA
jgi:hypothetical protein